MNLLFENKVALVTGAGSGMGLATAKAFAEAGASVVLADIQEDGPAQVLLKRAVIALVDGPEKDHPVWDLPGK